MNATRNSSIGLELSKSKTTFFSKNEYIEKNKITNEIPIMIKNFTFNFMILFYLHVHKFLKLVHQSAVDMMEET